MLHDSQEISKNLASALPVGTSARLYHVCSQADRTESLFAPSLNKEDPNLQAEETTREDHLLFVTQDVLDDDDEAQEVAVLAVVLVVYNTSSTVTIYVSKADSSGHKQAGSLSAQYVPSTGVLMSKILEAFVRDKSTDGHMSSTTRKIVLCLCAKSQNQYLFPGSIENEAKRVLDDRALIKWWSRVFDRTMHAVGSDTRTRSVLLTEKTTIDKNVTCKGYLVIPGGDRNEIRRHLLPRSGSGELAWQNRYPIGELVHRYDESVPIRCLIPRFPDDPKTRLWHDLEESDRNGLDSAWRAVKSLDSFWNDHLAYRKESCAGRFVGFMWAIFTWGLESSAVVDGDDGSHQIMVPIDQHGQEGKGRVEVNELTKVNGQSVHHDSIRDREHAHENPVKLLQPINSSIANLTAASYEEFIGFTQDTDFAGLKTAAASTAEWIAKAKELAGISDFGILVLGKSDSTSTSDRDGTQESSIRVWQKQIVEPVVTMLTGRKQKKRKAAAVDGAEGPEKKQKNEIEDENKLSESQHGSIDSTPAGRPSMTVLAETETIQSTRSALEASDTNLLAPNASVVNGENGKGR